MPSQADLLQLYASAQYFQGGGTEGYAAGYDVSARTQSRLYEMILDQIGRPPAGAKTKAVIAEEAAPAEEADQAAPPPAAEEKAPPERSDRRKRAGKKAAEQVN